MLILILVSMSLSCRSVTKTIPARVENSVSAHSEGVAVPLDLNSAGAEEIADLPGIGPGLAAKIVSHRERFGPFGSPLELMLVEGFSEARYLRIEGLVSARGPAR